MVSTKSVFLNKNLCNNIKFSIINNTKLFIKKTKNLNKFYITIPKDIKWSLASDYINFYSANYTNLSLFTNSFIIWLKKQEVNLKKRLLLKGLGFRVSFSDNKDKLILKAGFSHLLEINIPKDKVAITLQKNLMIFHGEDSIFLGNFCNKIRCFRPADSYKGRGFILRDRIFKLKPVKKK